MTTPSKIMHRDRWADLAVIVVVVVALLLGLWLRHAALYRVERFTIAEAGIAGRAPAGWVQQRDADPLLRARDPFRSAFNTVLELRSRPLADSADPAMALDALALERAAAVDAYTPLAAERVLVNGAAAVQRPFAYVLVDHNPYVNRLPQVVRGVDVALRDAGRVIIVTFLADGDAFDADYRYFRAFIESLEY